MSIFIGCGTWMLCTSLRDARSAAMAAIFTDALCKLVRSVQPMLQLLILKVNNALKALPRPIPQLPRGVPSKRRQHPGQHMALPCDPSRDVSKYWIEPPPPSLVGHTVQDLRISLVHPVPVS